MRDVSNDPERAQDLAALRWQLEIGARDAVGETPVERIEQGRREIERGQRRTRPAASPPAAPASPQLARQAAEAASDLPSLREAIQAFEGSPLKRSARNTVVSDGNPAARVMIVGEAPGAEEDRVGRPFVGPAGKLLDRALAAIGLDRTSEDPATAVYITNILFWRPPNNRTPTQEEMTLFLPFTERHIALVRPAVLFPLGNVACKSLLRTSTGITKLRGRWQEWRSADGEIAVPALPSLHPAFLLRTASAKKLFWEDLQSLRDRLAQERPGGEGPDRG